MQEDWEIRPKLLAATLALRTEYYLFTGWNHQPTVRLLLTPSARHSFWGAWSRSVRVPARGEIDGSGLATVYGPGAAGPLPLAIEVISNPDLMNERGDSFESGYRGQLTRRVVADTAFFVAHHRGGLGFQPNKPVVRFLGQSPYVYLPLTYSNQTDVDSLGWESSLRYAISNNLQVTGAYSWLHFLRIASRIPGSPIDSSELVATSPAHQFQVQAQWRPARRWECDLAYFLYTPRINAQPDQLIPRHRADLRIGWHFSETAELSAGVQNLTGGNRYEFVIARGPAQAPTQPAAYLRLSFRF